MKKPIRSLARAVAAGLGVAAASYAAFAAVTWIRYGSPRRSRTAPNLDQFIAAPEVVERHETWIAAPAPYTYSAACEMDLQASPVIRGIFKARLLFMGGETENEPQPRGLVAQTKAIGWGVLFEEPNRETVLGAITQPWVANPVFRALPPDAFASFQEPGWVKIVWNLHVKPVGDRWSVFRTETRASTTDAAARAKFRRYWSLVSPGVWLIRYLSLGPLKREAERRFRELQLVDRDTAEKLREEVG